MRRGATAGNSGLTGPVLTLFEVCQKERQRQRVPERVFEARPVRRRRYVTEIDGVLIDQDLYSHK